MTIELPTSAFFLPQPAGDNRGVDFLGIRQVNLDMMAELIPSTNNATPYIRPFSLLCWLYWKFHQLCDAAGIDQPTGALLEAFRERIEVLFTWGAKLDDYPEIPGKSADPPPSRDGRVPLTFADWGRVASSTGLMAALWYGPASKTETGLGFLQPRGNGFFRVVGRGIDLARAMDGRLRMDKARYDQLLATLDPVRASGKDAAALWRRWAPGHQLQAEMTAFAGALFSEREVGKYDSLIGKRSSTLALARLFLRHRGKPASSDQIREGMFLAADRRKGAFAVPETLIEAHRKWVILQMRQLQRLALETFLSWCESRIQGGDHDTAALAAAAVQSWRDHALFARKAEDFGQILRNIGRRFSTFETFLSECRKRPDRAPFDLMDKIWIARRDADPALPALCLSSLHLCAAFALCLPPRTPEIHAGGAYRLSLHHLAHRFQTLISLTMAEAVRFSLEAFVISQHFVTAVNRFDGVSQRLRLTIEEDGLSLLVGEPWAPVVAEDRLSILLSLAGYSGLLNYLGDDRYAWTGA